MAVAELDPKGNVSKNIELSDIREAIFEGEEALEKSDLDVLEVMANDKKGLVKRVLRNKVLIEKAGNPDQLLFELDQLEAKYREQIQTIEALKSYEKKVEKQSWGRWALEKVKSVALFPVRHPVYTLLILAAVAAGIGFLYYGLGEALLTMIPNYASKVVDVAKSGVKAISEKMTELGKSVYEGELSFSKGIGADQPPVARPYDTGGPGLFSSPNTPTGILSEPPSVLTPPSVPPVPGAGTVPVQPILPDGASSVGTEIF